MYDVYFTTGIGKISTGVDIWVNNWLSEVSKDLNTQPVLLIYRTKPTDFNFDIPIEHYWYNDETGNHRDIFEEKFRECRRVNILHAHYTPLELIEENKDKIHSYIIHNCLDKVVVETGISDLPFGWTPYYSQKWESEILSAIVFLFLLERDFSRYSILARSFSSSALFFSILAFSVS